MISIKVYKFCKTNLNEGKTMSKLSKLLIKKYDVVSRDYVILEELDIKFDEIIVESNRSYVNIYAMASKKKVLDKTFKECSVIFRHNVIEVLL
jgi:ABC-type metal ion transport system substrate-binding protein